MLRLAQRDNLLPWTSRISLDFIDSDFLGLRGVLELLALFFFPRRCSKFPLRTTDSVGDPLSLEQQALPFRRSQTGTHGDNYSRARTENDFGPAVFQRCRYLCGLGSGLGCGVCDAVALIGDVSD